MFPVKQYMLLIVIYLFSCGRNKTLFMWYILILLRKVSIYRRNNKEYLPKLYTRHCYIVAIILIALRKPSFSIYKIDNEIANLYTQKIR